MACDMNISDHYVDLLERVIVEIKQLREEIKKQGRSQEKMLGEFGSRINQLASSPEEVNKTASKRRRKQMDIPQLCRVSKPLFEKYYLCLI